MSYLAFPRMLRLTGFLLLALAAGCGPRAAQMPPMVANVTVSRPLQREVTDWDEYTGHLESPQSANIQSRVTGLITEAPFKEGTLVNQGDILFSIDDRPFKADLDNKLATVAKDEAQLTFMQAQLARTSKLLQTHVEAQQDYDTAEANYQQSAAQLAADKAAQENSALNLEWTKVRAPIAGRVGKINVTVGNLITGGVGNGTLLTSIVSVNPMYCYVPVPERTFLKYEAFARTQKEPVRSGLILCAIELENETGFPHRGSIDFIDNSVDPATGTIQVRGVFNNPDAFLTPGLFARMRINGSGVYKALLVPDEAIGTSQNERFVLVLAADNTVQTKPVELGRLFGTLRAIQSGLTPADRVVIDGLQMARPGSKVNAMPGTIPEPPPASLGVPQAGAASTPSHGGAP